MDEVGIWIGRKKRESGISEIPINETIEKYGLEWSLFGTELYPELVNDESLIVFESNQEWDEESNQAWDEELNQEWEEWNPSLGKWEEWNACLKNYDNLFLNGVYPEQSELLSQSPFPLVNAYQKSDTELIDLLETEDQTNIEVINTNHVSLAGLSKLMYSYLMLKKSLESENR
jgi:hypothetical protein